MGPLTPKLSLQLWKHDEQGEEGICHQGGPGQGHFNHHNQQHRLHSADVCPERGILGISSLAPFPKHHLCAAACLRTVPLFGNSSGNQWERRKGGIEGVEAGYLLLCCFYKLLWISWPSPNSATAVAASLCFQLLYSAALLHSCQAALYRAMKEQRHALHSILSLLPRNPASS